MANQFRHVDEWDWDDELEAEADFVEHELTEFEAFQSVLDISRKQNRENFLKNLKNLPEPKSAAPTNFTMPDENLMKEPNPEIAQDPRISISKSWFESPDKQRNTAADVYHDFLLHKQNDKIRRRKNELRTLGLKLPSGGYHSFTADKSKSAEEKRRYSIGAGENYFDKTISFLVKNGAEENLQELLNESAIAWEEKEERKQLGKKDEAPETDTERKINYIVEDQYYPGLLEDAVNQKVDYTQIAFDMSIGEDQPIPDTEPENYLSLIEAFDIRVRREEGAIKKAVKMADFSHEDRKFGEQPRNFSQVEEIGPNIRFLNRDEVVLANAVEVELAVLTKNKPQTELTAAIACLQRAEIMNDFDKSLQSAEEAYAKAPPDLAETAAVLNASQFRTEQVTKRQVTIPTKSYRPIEIISYMGLTKPSQVIQHIN